MIYDAVDQASPIRQGDIFVGLPRVEIELSTMVLVNEDAGGLSVTVEAWDRLTSSQRVMRMILPVRSVAAIVVTQDCDALRSDDITLCEIRPFTNVEGMARTANSPKSWMKILTQHARVNLKWFYLPTSGQIGFPEKMAVDFRSTLRLPTAELSNMRHLRRGRLNAEADEHFRERLSEFFRRYPYDEWYPLNPEEFGEYRKTYPDAEPREWQRS